MKDAEILREGGVGVIATDTLYGVVASALNEVAVKRVYEIKGRAPSKPCIILIASAHDVRQFGVTLTHEREKVLEKYWPGPVSIILPIGDTTLEYLHRGTRTLAFRLPNDPALQEFLKVSGPLIAPSANPEGLPPATTIEGAKEYFGDRVDFYLDSGVRLGKPSTIIALDAHDDVIVVRPNFQGAKRL